MTGDASRPDDTRSAFRLPGTGAQLGAQVDDELRFHLEERIEELMAQGRTREEAEREAHRRFGDVRRIGAECVTIDRDVARRQGRGERLHALRRDVRYALRGMVARPGYTAIIVLTLALAIGANTAIYSAVNHVLLRPLPVAGLDRLAVLQADILRIDATDAPLSIGAVVDLGARTDVFEAVTGLDAEDVTLSGGTEPRRLAATQTVGDFATVFGVRPAVGRFYDPAASEPGRHRVVVLSHGLWQELSGGDPGMVGRTIVLNDSTYQVVGVMPADFRYPRAASLWMPRPVTESDIANRGRLIMEPVVARVRPGVTMPQVQAQLRAESGRWQERFPDSYYGDPSAFRLHADSFLEELSGQLRPILLVLLGAVVFVLLIACANVASLQLVRTTGRAKEVALRAALGAGRWPIVRQFLVESLMLALAGGVVGLAIGWLALRALARWDVTRYEALRDVGLDGAVLALTVGVTLLAGLLFGVVPAWRASRVSAQEVLKESGGRGTSLGSGRNRFLQATVVVQIALTLVLLLGSGVMIRSLTELIAVDPGFSGERTMAMQITPSGSRYPRAQRLTLYDGIVERLRGMPGFEAVALTSRVPFSDMLLDSSPFGIRGANPDDFDGMPHANAAAVTPDYFRAMGIRLLQGRAFTDADREGAAPVAIVNEQLAQQYFPGENPVGRQIDHYGFDGITIVGVARNVDEYELGSEPYATIYYPYAQLPYRWAAIVVRSQLPPGAVTRMVRDALHEIDPQMPVHDAQTMPQRISRSLGARQLAVAVLGGFAAIALLLALLGTYGVLSYSTSQRRRELGIRLALGARPGEVVGMVLRSGLTLAGIGLIVGVGAYLGAGRALQALLYGVSPNDPATLLAGVVLLAMAAVVACWIPARRAARVDPAVTLRAE